MTTRKYFVRLLAIAAIVILILLSLSPVFSLIAPQIIPATPTPVPVETSSDSLPPAAEEK